MDNPYNMYEPFSQDSSYHHVHSASLTQRQQRSLVFHLLYAMDACAYDISLQAIAENLSRGFGYIITPEDAVFQRAHDVIAYRDDLDTEIQPLLEKWRFERIGVVTRLILRYAMWELKYTQQDSVVVINEAVELAKCFAELEAYKFINGILDRWVKERREAA